MCKVIAVSQCTVLVTCHERHLTHEEANRLVFVCKLRSQCSRHSGLPCMRHSGHPSIIHDQVNSLPLERWTPCLCNSALTDMVNTHWITESPLHPFTAYTCAATAKLLKTSVPLLLWIPTVLCPTTHEACCTRYACVPVCVCVFQCVWVGACVCAYVVFI
jgi:hypothetical protein